MSVVGEVKGFIDLFIDGWKALGERRDPVRRQAHRMIVAFEAHGIGRQQIARILPRELSMTPATFSTAEKLKDTLTHPLLDWASDYLVLSRRWLDGIEDCPHQRIEGYKNEQVYEQWFRERLERAPGVSRRLCVWAAAVPKLGWANPPGYLSLVYVEDQAGLDEEELSRYWLLSNQWPLNHAPCIESMLKVVGIARAMRIMVVGNLLSRRNLRHLEHGRIFAPEAAMRLGRMWHPEDVALTGSSAA